MNPKTGKGKPMRHVFRHTPTGNAVKLKERDNAGQLWVEIYGGPEDGKAIPVEAKELGSYSNEEPEED
jgi:hypothetical protein